MRWVLFVEMQDQEGLYSNAYLLKIHIALSPPSSDSSIILEPLPFQPPKLFKDSPFFLLHSHRRNVHENHTSFIYHSKKNMAQVFFNSVKDNQFICLGLMCSHKRQKWECKVPKLCYSILRPFWPARKLLCLSDQVGHNWLQHHNFHVRESQ